MAKRKDELHPPAYVATHKNVGVNMVDKCKILDTALEPMIESGEYTSGGVPGKNECFLDTEKVYFAKNSVKKYNGQIGFYKEEDYFVCKILLLNKDKKKV